MWGTRLTPGPSGGHVDLAPDVEASTTARLWDHAKRFVMRTEHSRQKRENRLESPELFSKMQQYVFRTPDPTKKGTYVVKNQVREVGREEASLLKDQRLKPAPGRNAAVPVVACVCCFLVLFCLIMLHVFIVIIFIITITIIIIIIIIIIFIFIFIFIIIIIIIIFIVIFIFIFIFIII
ncbi:hypothetical protein AK812_SmicGene26081 [Symbiodinium microadriaticum]|uniref:Uncharacterized protein n=1 Tax=Symbiodinium microadriaticum TaxID=2951 RepID=A0A1Q9DAE2_SYMMI|nr:hypothetical protein AK812_SmicGene26081 [Symbiodinium microadriaticum]